MTMYMVMSMRQIVITINAAKAMKVIQNLYCNLRMMKRPLLERLSIFGGRISGHLTRKARSTRTEQIVCHITGHVETLPRGAFSGLVEVDVLGSNDIVAGQAQSSCLGIPAIGLSQMESGELPPSCRGSLSMLQRIESGELLMEPSPRKAPDPSTKRRASGRSEGEIQGRPLSDSDGRAAGHTGGRESGAGAWRRPPMLQVSPSIGAVAIPGPYIASRFLTAACPPVDAAEETFIGMRSLMVGAAAAMVAEIESTPGGQWRPPELSRWVRCDKARLSIG